MKLAFTRWIRLFYPHLVFLLALMYFFHRELFFNQLYSAGDVLIQNYPVKAFFRDSIVNGIIPLWAPFISNGFPLLAEGQGGFLYPLHWLFFTIAPTFTAFNLNLISCFIIAYYGSYIYIRSLGYGRIFGLSSGLVFAMNGFSVGHLYHSNMLTVAFLFPYILLFTDKYLQNRGKPKINLLAIATIFSFQILAGHPQFFYYNLIFASVYFFFVLFEERCQGKTKKILAYFSAVSFSFLMGAAQLLPAIELTTISRGTDQLGRILLPTFIGDFYSMKQLVYQLLPNYRIITDSSISQDMSYCGIIPVFLLPLSLLLKGKRMGYFRVMFVCSFLMMFEPVASSSNLITNIVSALGRFRHPIRLSFYFFFAIAFFFGRALEYYAKTDVENEQMKRWVPCLAGILMMGVSGWMLFSGRFVTYHWQPALIAISLLIVLAATFFPGSRKKITVLCLLIILFDLLAFSGGRHHFRNRENIEGQQNISRIIKDPGYRYFAHNCSFGAREEALEFLALNIPLLHRVLSFHGYSPIAPQLWQRYRSFIEAAINNANINESFLPIGRRLLQLANVKYIHTRNHLSGDLFPKLSSPQLYQVPEAFPRAFCCDDFLIARNETETFNALMGDDLFLLFEKHIWRASLHPDTKSTTSLVTLGPKREATITKESINSVTIAAETEHPCYLILNDLYYPGWRAYVDGNKTEIVRANYLFRAIRINGGKHIINFVFHPNSFLLGLFLSLLSITIVLAYFGWSIVVPRESKR